MKMAVWQKGDKRRVYVIITQSGYKLSNQKPYLFTKNTSFSFSNG